MESKFGERHVEIERIQRKYLKFTLGLDRTTPEEAKSDEQWRWYEKER